MTDEQEAELLAMVQSMNGRLAAVENAVLKPVVTQPGNIAAAPTIPYVPPKRFVPTQAGAMREIEPASVPPA
jgi:hypothetical protein